MLHLDSEEIHHRDGAAVAAVEAGVVADENINSIMMNGRFKNKCQVIRRWTFVIPRQTTPSIRISFRRQTVNDGCDNVAWNAHAQFLKALSFRLNSESKFEEFEHLKFSGTTNYFS